MLCHLDLLHLAFLYFVIPCLSVPLSFGNEVTSNCESNYNYDMLDPAHGPQHWYSIENCYQKCAGNNQSPINIVTSESTYDESLSFNLLNNADTRVPAIVYNKGHSPQFEGLKDDILLSVTPSGQNKYVFEKMHFHTGPANLNGSEHSIDGKFAPMEVHMIFYNSIYGSFGMSKDKSDGLLVVAVHIYAGSLFDALLSTDRPQCKMRYAAELSKMLETHLPWVSHYYADNPLYFLSDGLNPADALPYSKKYYCYKGSLTTPPCYETVTWVVMECPIMVSTNAYLLLKTVEDDEGHAIRDHGNRRPIQRELHHGIIRNFDGHSTML